MCPSLTSPASNAGRLQLCTSKYRRCKLNQALICPTDHLRAAGFDRHTLRAIKAEGPGPELLILASSTRSGRMRTFRQNGRAPSLTEHLCVAGFDRHTLRAIKAEGPGPELLIPPIIHQTWKDENIPPEWQGAQQACKDLHPGWEYRLWTDNSSHALMADKYPQLLRTFERYPYNIERADAIRWACCLLLRTGSAAVQLG